VNRVLILSASAGAGHLRAADAVLRAVQLRLPGASARHVDTLEYTNPLFRRLYSKAYIDMVNSAPEVLGWLYDVLDTPWERERRRLVLDRLNTRPFVHMLEDYQPDVAVCTHFLPAEIISWLRAKGRLTCRQAIVVTDLDVHAMWLCHHFERYYVALEETQEHLVRLGIPREKVLVSGIPVDPVFAEQRDKAQMRQQYGLEPELTTILISAGGFGVGPSEHLLTALGDLRHPAQVLMMCGRNEELRRKVQKLAKARKPGQPLLHAVGFTTKMDEYMAASDVIVGKPGGLTTSEALARGLVMVIVNPIPGQEERNSDHLIEEGVAIRCNNLPVLAWKIDRLLDDPKRYRAMQAAARRLGNPKAAFTIVDDLARL
jgi:processive 1,2-diacylglycerol beta-glucosyltransferase